MDPLSIAQAETKISDFEATLKDGAKTEYEQKKKERMVLRRKVTMAINNVLDAISTDPYNNNQTKAYLRKLTEAAEKLEEGQFELELLITNEEAASLDAQLHQHRYGKKVVEAETAANNQISITARTTVGLDLLFDVAGHVFACLRLSLSLSLSFFLLSPVGHFLSRAR